MKIIDRHGREWDSEFDTVREHVGLISNGLLNVGESFSALTSDEVSLFGTFNPTNRNQKVFLLLNWHAE